ncbi:MAG: glucans biosynthesis glucosyltransferase MdoH [Wenzhouxiangella sp.]
MARLTRARRWHLLLSISMALALTYLLYLGLDRANTHAAWTAIALALFFINALALAAAASVAVFGLASHRPRTASDAERSSPGRCAVVWLLCGEPPEPLADRASELLLGLEKTGQHKDCRIFILSDTRGEQARTREGLALGPLRNHVVYRNRPEPEGRKPGNLLDWLDHHAEGFETLLVLDADSSFSAQRLLAARRAMAAEPELGLLQSGIRLRPGATRFAHMQRLSSRLAGGVFLRGLARLSGDAGNYWGHNALLRVAAFRQVAELPLLSGRPPWGGPILSHDFIEAAFLRRLGWTVRILPTSEGSFEDAPETVASYFRRDRRWAQGNLQHSRIVGTGGLHPSSRLHILTGIQSYLAAPSWLALLLLTGSGTVHATAGVIWPLLLVLLLLMLPKLLAMLSWPALRRRRPRRIVLRATGAELLMTTLFAPLSMVRRTAFLAALAAGRDQGWVPSGAASPLRRGDGLFEAASGLVILAAVMTPQLILGSWYAAGLSGLLVLPVVLPLLLARFLVRWFDQVRQPALAGKKPASQPAGERIALPPRVVFLPRPAERHQVSGKRRRRARA